MPRTFASLLMLDFFQAHAIFRAAELTKEGLKREIERHLERSTPLSKEGGG